jgi:O-antigen ligase
LALTGLALVLVGFGFATGDFATAGEMTQRGDRLVAHRATSLTSNANTLGVSCVWAFAGLAVLWRKTSRLWQQGLIISLTLPLLAGIIYSGSRKAIVMVPVFVVSWVWFCYRRLLFRRAAVLIAVGIAALACTVGGAFVLRDTYVGYRLRGALTTGEKDSSTENRLAILREGLEMVAEHPLAGVGLYQFAAHSRLAGYSHNDYLEVAVTTGFTGFLIYYSLFILVAWRLVHLRKHSLHPEMNYAAGLSLAVLATCAVAGFSLVMFSSTTFWCFISGIPGFVSAAERYLKHRPTRVSRSSFRPRISQRPKPATVFPVARR